MFEIIKTTDYKILRFINKKIKNKTLDKIMPFITWLGNGGIVWFVITLIMFKQPQYKKDSILIVLSLACPTGIVEGIIKPIVRRTRPFFQEDERAELLIKKPITYSFPSGHSASSFSVATVFIRRLIPFTPVVVILAILISFSRLYLNVHYPTDVICGGIIGSICGVIIIGLF